MDIESNDRVSWEERGQLGRSLCSQSDRKVTLIPPTMNDEAQKQEEKKENFWKVFM